MMRWIFKICGITTLMLFSACLGWMGARRYGWTPTASVIISSYNMADTLPQAIRSIEKQTLTSWELIVIDDGSTDNTAKILRSYRFKDPRIRVISNKKNLGLTESLRRGVAAARGKYIARLDADDTSYPDRLARQTLLMDTQNLDLLGGNFDTSDRLFQESDPIDDDWLDTDEIGLELLFNNVFAHSTIMIRKSFLDEHHLTYSLNRPNAEDYDLWLRIFINGGRLGLMGGRPVSTYHYSGHSRQWWDISDKSARLSRLKALKRIAPKISSATVELPMCDFLPFLIKGNQATHILNPKKLDTYELGKCLPELTFHHPHWTDELVYLGNSRFMRKSTSDAATVSRTQTGVFVEWDNYDAESFKCTAKQCVKIGYNSDKED